LHPKSKFVLKESLHSYKKWRSPKKNDANATVFGASGIMTLTKLKAARGAR